MQTQLVIIWIKRFCEGFSFIAFLQRLRDFDFGPGFKELFVYNEPKMAGDILISYGCKLRKTLKFGWDENQCNSDEAQSPVVCVSSVGSHLWSCGLSGCAWCRSHLLHAEDCCISLATEGTFPFQCVIMYTFTYQMRKRSWSSHCSTAVIFPCLLFKMDKTTQWLQ